MFLVSPTEWFYRDRWCHCCVLALSWPACHPARMGARRREGRDLQSLPGSPGTPSSYWGVQTFQDFTLGYLRWCQLYSVAFGLLPNRFFFLFVIKKRKKEQNLQSDFCSLFLFVCCLHHLKGFWLCLWVNVGFHLWGVFLGGAGVFQSTCALQKMGIYQQWLVLWWGMVQLWLEWDSFGMRKGLGLWMSTGSIVGSVQMFVHFPASSSQILQDLEILQKTKLHHS